MCPPRPNDLLHLRKQKGLKSSTFCTIDHGFRGSVVTLLRNRVNFGRHLVFLAHCRKTFLTSSLAYYPNSVVGFRLLLLISCGYISPNPEAAPNCNKNLFQSAEGESLITIEPFDAIIVSAGATLNAAK